ncbi:MAG: carbohydrate kinase family protein [Candidatus Thorarchaeota archaeon]|nr:MAG: hypothetical protein DRP09_03040 [Candidatus Thorarchaeota archaeon]RLI59835.1 MAG: hypothetical protein DRO87_01760 [Candidatus Thorarchaeota archaeon]
MEIVVIGHLSRDLIMTPSLRREVLGGGAAYAMLAPAIGAFGAGIVTKVGSDFEEEYLQTLRESRLDLSGLSVSGAVSTRFINEYDASGRRTQRVEGVAPPITPEDFSERHLGSSIIHFSPITPGEIEVDCIREAEYGDALISLDVQGHVRAIDDEGAVHNHRWKDPHHILEMVNVVKFHEDELSLTVDAESELSAVSAVLDMGPRIVLITRSDRGSTVYTRNAQIDIPMVLSRRQIDATGCGDTYTIAFLLEYIRSGSVKRAGYFAATCSAFNVEHLGPYDFPTRSAVEMRMSKYL